MKLTSYLGPEEPIHNNLPEVALEDEGGNISLMFRLAPRPTARVAVGLEMTREEVVALQQLLNNYLQRSARITTAFTYEIPSSAEPEKQVPLATKGLTPEQFAEIKSETEKNEITGLTVY